MKNTSKPWHTRFNEITGSFSGVISVLSLFLSAVSVYFCINIFVLEQERIKTLQFLKNEIEPLSTNIFQKTSVIANSSNLSQIQENNQYIKTDIARILERVKYYAVFMDRYADVRLPK